MLPHQRLSRMVRVSVCSCGECTQERTRPWVPPCLAPGGCGGWGGVDAGVAGLRGGGARVGADGCVYGGGATPLFRICHPFLCSAREARRRPLHGARITWVHIASMKACMCGKGDGPYCGTPLLLPPWCAALAAACNPAATGLAPAPPGAAGPHGAAAAAALQPRCQLPAGAVPGAASATPAGGSPPRRRARRRRGPGGGGGRGCGISGALSSPPPFDLGGTRSVRTPVGGGGRGAPGQGRASGLLLRGWRLCGRQGVAAGRHIRPRQGGIRPPAGVCA